MESSETRTQVKQGERQVITCWPQDGLRAPERRVSQVMIIVMAERNRGNLVAVCVGSLCSKYLYRQVTTVLASLAYLALFGSSSARATILSG